MKPALSSRYLIVSLGLDGIIVPATRRIFWYEGDHVTVRDLLLVAIDMGEITFNQ